MTEERMFPILLLPLERKKFPDCPKEIPWRLVTPHEKQAKENHFQTLEELAKRGGLGPQELWCVIKDHRFVPEIALEDSVVWLHGLLGTVP